MRSPAELVGVWRLLGVTKAGRPVSTGQSHLVIEPSRLWEVWPAQVVHDDDEGPERPYEVRARGDLWEIDIYDRRGPRLGLAALGDDGLLTLRVGDDERPGSMDDDGDASLATYRREMDEPTRLRLVSPLPRVARIRRVHPRLGALGFDANLGWWEGALPAGALRGVGERSLRFHVCGPVDIAEARLDDAAERVGRIELSQAKARAVADLLEVHNEYWREADGDEPSPPLTATAFETRLTLDSLGVQEDGGLELWFDDGDLFWGHSVLVELDADLAPIRASFHG